MSNHHFIPYTLAVEPVVTHQTSWLESIINVSTLTLCNVCRVRHKDFLRPAADHKAVSHAMRFVKLLPSHMTDARTYNMLVSVCIAARDLPMALQAGMMLRNTGRRLDTFLYTSLITGGHVSDSDTTHLHAVLASQHTCVPSVYQVHTCMLSWHTCPPGPYQVQ